MPPQITASASLTPLLTSGLSAPSPACLSPWATRTHTLVDACAQSGEIELDELQGACRVLGANESEAEAMLDALDTDHDGGISFEEFLRAAAPLYLSSRAAIRRCFDFFDTDHSGYIDAPELEVVLCRLGWSSSHGRMHKGVLERIFDTADTNHDGKVSFAEFMALFANAGTAQALKGADAAVSKKQKQS